MHGGIQAVELVFLLLLLFVVVFGALAHRLRTPYPIILVIAGLLLSFVPGIPRVSLNPDVIFFVVLPPLLYYAAWVTSWRDFSHNLVSILLLAFGLVAFTVVGVSIAVQSFVPGFGWKLGVVLGAIIAPTDALAATTIAKKIALPKRIVDILEGESLVNDASGLLALEFGIAMVVRNQTPTFTEGLFRIAYLVLVGIGIGLAAGWIVNKFERQIDHAPIEIAISILVPYSVYFAADVLHASGVLAVIVCGLILSRRSSEFFTPEVRLQSSAVWDTLNFILNGLVFVLIGLQLPYVLAGIQGYNLKTLVFYGGLFSALVILLRLIWIFPGAALAYKIRNTCLHQHEKLPAPQGILIVGWTGMRGVIALAAAIALPQTLADGSPFPFRDLIVYLAFSVIFVTLVLQGLTLPAVVRLLKIKREDGPNLEEQSARREMLQAAIGFLEDSRLKDKKKYDDVYADLSGHYQQRLIALREDSDEENEVAPEHYRHHARLLRDLLRVERLTAVRLRDQGHINDETLRQLEYELDLREVNPSGSI